MVLELRDTICSAPQLFPLPYRVSKKYVTRAAYHEARRKELKPRKCYACGATHSRVKVTRRGTPYQEWCLNGDRNGLVLCSNCAQKYLDPKRLVGEDLRKFRVEHRTRLKIPFEDTKIEKILQQALMKIGIPFKAQKRFSAFDGYHSCDIFIEPNIIIEADGDYWHSRIIRGKDIPMYDYKLDVELERQRLQGAALLGVRHQEQFTLGHASQTATTSTY